MYIIDMFDATFLAMLCEVTIVWAAIVVLLLGSFIMVRVDAYIRRKQAEEQHRRFMRIFSKHH